MHTTKMQKQCDKQYTGKAFHGQFTPNSIHLASAYMQTCSWSCMEPFMARAFYDLSIIHASKVMVMHGAFYGKGLLWLEHHTCKQGFPNAMVAKS